jgi:mRNA-degrading endonuclease RelE of RelBE toxin-antitoxin system
MVDMMPYRLKFQKRQLVFQLLWPIWVIETYNLRSVPNHIYGKPLQRTLKGYWKLRVGSYRIVYKIEHENIIILGIIHRKTVYAKIKNRAD